MASGSGELRQSALLTIAIWCFSGLFFLLPQWVAGAEIGRFTIASVALVAVSGTLISGLLYAVASLTRSSAALVKWPAMAATALGCSLTLSAVDAWLHEMLLGLFSAREMIGGGMFLKIVTNFIGFAWLFGLLAAIYVVLQTNRVVRERERALALAQTAAAEAEAAAGAARLAALRYQLNPHFLFNTLNSIAALVGGRQNRPAETMVENLSDFLRAGLALDPHDDVPLAREIELQALYLEIERSRYPGRLSFATDVPERLKGARVPSLITQPLIEAAVRLSVARSTMPVQLTVRAMEEEGSLLIEIDALGGDSPLPTQAEIDAAVARVDAPTVAGLPNAQAVRLQEARPGMLTIRLELPLIVSRASEQN